MPDANERESRSITLRGPRSLRPRAQRPHRAAEPTPLRSRGCAAGGGRAGPGGGSAAALLAEPGRAALHRPARPPGGSSARREAPGAARRVPRGGPPELRLVLRFTARAEFAVLRPTLRRRTVNNSILPFSQS